MAAFGRHEREMGILVAAITAAAMSTISTTWWILQSVFSGGMLGLFLLGWASRRVSSVQAGMATLLGMAAVAWVVFFQKSFHPNLSIVFGTVVLFASGLGLHPYIIAIKDSSSVIALFRFRRLQDANV